MELELNLGGIIYDVEVDIDDEYVCDVMGVEIYDGEKFHKIKMTNNDLMCFYEKYEDELNEAYQSEMVARAELAAEEKWERENDR